MELYENKELGNQWSLGVGLAGPKGTAHKNLQGLSNHYVSTLTLPKVRALQMSNSEAPLSEAQVKCAAADVLQLPLWCKPLCQMSNALTPAHHCSSLFGLKKLPLKCSERIERRNKRKQKGKPQSGADDDASKRRRGSYTVALRLRRYQC